MIKANIQRLKVNKTPNAREVVIYLQCTAAVLILIPLPTRLSTYSCATVNQLLI